MKRKHCDLSSPIQQYVIGLLVGLGYFLILFASSDISYANLQAPEGLYADNLWAYSDFMSYVQPARNFLENAVFGTGQVPDHFRTIGYPAFIALMIKLFGDSWLYATYVIQAFIYSLIYPVVSGIIQMIYPGNRQIVKWTFIVSLVSGIYFTRVPCIGSDLFFTAFFLFGIYSGIKSITTKSWKHLLLYVLFISIAAQVRPTLFFYPLVSFVLMAFIAKRSARLNQPFTKLALILSTTALLFTCNLPSLRNYLNHGFFKSSTVMEKNLFICLDQGILKREGQLARYISLRQSVDNEQDIKKRMRLEKDITLEIIGEFPLTTAIVILYDNMKDVWLENHLVNHTGMFYNYSWKESGPVGPSGFNRHPFKGSNLLFAGTWIMMFLYFFVYCLFIAFCIRLIKKREWLFLLTLLLLIGSIMGPAVITGNAGSRFRLPIEAFIMIFALYQLQQWKRKRSDNCFTDGGRITEEVEIN